MFRIREDVAPPENELQKAVGDIGHQPHVSNSYHQREISEHEHRIRKSIEKLSAPDWYRDYNHINTNNDIRPPTATTSGIFSSSRAGNTASYQASPILSPNVTIQQRYNLNTSKNQYTQQPWSYTHSGLDNRSLLSPPLGGISFPTGLFYNLNLKFF